jgi:hypothetical protein
MTEFAAALSSLKVAFDLLKGINSLNVDVIVKQKTAELFNSLITVQSAMASLQIDYQELLQTKDKLTQQLVQLEEWDKKKDHYSLFGDATAIVMIPNSKHPTPEPRRYLCTNCFKDKKESILQKRGSHGAAPFYCPECKAVVQMFR